MSEIDQLIQELDDVVQGSTVLSYNSVSATFLVLYEIILTFPDELRFIWRSPWSFITILHLAIRYFSLVFLILTSYGTINTNLSVALCGNHLTAAGPFLNFRYVLVPAVDILIVLRVYALYKNNNTIGGILIFLWLAETAIILILTGLGFGPNKGASPNQLPGVLPNCDPIDPFNAHNLIVGGSVSMAFQAVYLGLTLYKLAVQFKSVRLLTPLLEIFIRDGALYCFNILAMYAVSVFFAQHYEEHTPLRGVGALWLVSIVTVTAGRLVVNLRKSVHINSLNNASNLSDESGSYELQFVNNVNDSNPSGPIQSTIIIDASQIRQSTGKEPLPSSHNLTLV